MFLFHILTNDSFAVYVLNRGLDHVLIKQKINIKGKINVTCSKKASHCYLLISCSMSSSRKSSVIIPNFTLLSVTHK